MKRPYDLGEELRRLTESDQSYRDKRASTFGRFGTTFARSLIIIYGIYRSIQKEMEKPDSRISLRDSDSSGHFEAEVTIVPIRYRRKTTLPNAVRPCFENLVRRRA